MTERQLDLQPSNTSRSIAKIICTAAALKSHENRMFPIYMCLGDLGAIPSGLISY